MSPPGHWSAKVSPNPRNVYPMPRVIGRRPVAMSRKRLVVDGVVPRRYWPESFSPKLSDTACALRARNWTTERSPPARETVVPGLSIGEAVMMCMTPSAALGPYSAAPGPLASSMRSMSMSVVGIMLMALILSAGMRA